MASETFWVRVEALGSAWRRWAEIGAELSKDEWGRRSRCEGWAIVDLFAHHSLFPLALAAPATGERQGDELLVVSAVDVLRGYNQPGGVAHTRAGEVAKRAIGDAGSISHADLIDRFAVIAPGSIDALRSAQPGLLVPWPATAALIPLVEALRIVLMEATVHLLDVFDALDRKPNVPEEALHETAALLTEMLDPVTLIEVATGRSGQMLRPILR